MTSEFITQHADLITKCLDTYVPSELPASIDLDDCRQVACMALLDAKDKYDRGVIRPSFVERNFSFTAMARILIAEALEILFAENTPVICELDEALEVEGDVNLERLLPTLDFRRRVKRARWSKNEEYVLAGILQDKKLQDIANNLGVTPSCISVYMNNIQERLTRVTTDEIKPIKVDPNERIPDWAMKYATGIRVA